MRTTVQIKDAIRAHLEAVVPPLLVGAGLSPFDAIAGETPYDQEQRLLCVYLAEGSDDTAIARESFIVHGQLPGEMYPDQYHDIIYEQGLKTFDPASVGADTKALTWQVWYPGEPTDGAGASFCIYEVSISNELDDCEE